MNDPNLSILLEVAGSCGRTTTDKVRKRLELMEEIIEYCWKYVQNPILRSEEELKEILHRASEEEYVDSSAYNEDDEDD